MSDSILLTMDDLETTVRANAVLEADGATTTLVSAMDDVVAAVTRADPEVIVLTGGLHERPTRDLVGLARDRSISTLGLLEETEPDPRGLASQLGLTGWLMKPVDARHVASTAQQLAQRRRLQRRTGIMGESPAIQELLVRIEQMAPVSSTVLIQGESGTGKELAAHALHELSPRRDKPFITVNCSALPETLLESELFGHEKGAFTGAAERRLGRFELASGGTLFLDEVGEMTLSVQVKLLRAVEGSTFFRVGGTESIHTDVRVVTATNRNLKEAVAEGDFREDLFFRLNVVPIHVPTLKERKGDVPVLLEHFTALFCDKYDQAHKKIDAESMRRLEAYDWPGNIREMKNNTERAVLFAGDAKTLTMDHFFPPVLKESGISREVFNGARTIAEVEREAIMATLEGTNQNRTQAAKILDISVKTLRNKLKLYGIAGVDQT